MSISTVHTMFDERVEAAPDAVAVRDSDTSLTYLALQQRSVQIAGALQQAGVGQGSFVGVALPRSADQIASLLGVLRCGAAYIPIDPTYPQDRIDYLVEDSGVRWVLCDKTAAEHFAGLEVILVDALDGATAPVFDPVEPKAEGPAYVIYTSGSTGKPKGVIVPHRALTNHAKSISSLYSLTAADTVLQVASISFDVAGEEIYPTLAQGACLVLRPPTLLESFDRFARFLRDQNITVANLSTAFWHAWVGHLERMNRSVPDGLRAVIVGTEQASPQHVNQWVTVTHGQVDWFNSYGPTETTITSTVYKHDGSLLPEAEPVPIGHAIANTTLHVLDDEGNSIEDGEVGELYIGGDGVALGYLDRPELTEDRFVADRDDPSRRMYRTGDRVRRQQDGSLVYVGRADLQVKIRGYRIELGEIESVLAQHQGVRSAVVVAHQTANDPKVLVAYVAAADPTDPPAPSSVQEFVAKRLPDYMIPSLVNVLADLPLTHNGKVDRDALPAPELSRRTRRTLAPPDTQTEEELLRIWCATLDIERIGVDESFFDLGGHSLHAVTVFGEIAHRYGVDLPLAELLAHPTIRALGGRIDALRGDVPTEPTSSGRLSVLPKVAAVLTRTARERDFQSLVPLRATGTEPPFFCITGTGGNVLLFHDLAERMPESRPFYGLQAHGVEGLRDPLPTIEEMASHYVADILRRFPNGPYFIGGYSGGAITAFEMAQQLRRQGREVGALINIDMQTGKLQTESGQDKVGRQRRAISEGGWKYFSNWFEKRLKWERERNTLRAIRAWARTTGKPIPLEYRERYMRESWYRARAAYSLQPYGGRMDVIRTAETQATYPDMGWDRVVEGGVFVHDLPGAHHTIVRPPYVSQLAETIELVLRSGRKR